jgi:polyphosphate kinase
MERNLDKRIEVACPIVDPKIQFEIDTVFNYQWKGSVKVREIRKDLKNTYRRPKAKPFHAQVELYNYYKNKANQD